MKNYRFNIFKISLILLFTSTGFLYSQDNKVNVTQDSKFEKILNEKRRINSSIIVNEDYKIQIYNGDSENAKKTLTAFKKDFKNFDGTILFNTPSYKVLVGNFKTRIEAERNLVEIRKTYKNALLIRPKN